MVQMPKTLFSWNISCFQTIVKEEKKKSYKKTCILGRVNNVSKKVFKNPLAFFAAILCILMGNWPQNGAHQIKSENFTLPKHGNVGCLSRGNGLKCWRYALRNQFGWVYREKWPTKGKYQSVLWYFVYPRRYVPVAIFFKFWSEASCIQM